MTNHPRRVWRRKHQRLDEQAPRFSDFPCPYCRGTAEHTSGCVTHVWRATSDQLAALQDTARHLSWPHGRVDVAHPPIHPARQQQLKGPL